MRIGSHMPISQGLPKALKNAKAIGANTFQFFTGNPRGGRAKTYSDEEYTYLHTILNEDFGPIIAHAPYTINLASSKDDVRSFACEQLLRSWHHAARLGATGLVVHTGSHTGAGAEKGVMRLVASLKTVLSQGPQGTRLLLETMAGSGSELGDRFAQIGKVLDTLRRPDALGVCLDTCHMHAAGYPLMHWSDVRTDLETAFPISSVGCLHLNDSKTPFASGKDRHEQLGKGFIGWDGLLPILQDPDIRKVPIILETPNTIQGWGEEIAEVRRQLKGQL